MTLNEAAGVLRTPKAQQGSPPALAYWGEGGGGDSTPLLSLSLLRPSNEASSQPLIVSQGLSRMVLGPQHAQWRAIATAQGLQALQQESSKGLIGCQDPRPFSTGPHGDSIAHVRCGSRHLCL